MKVCKVKPDHNVCLNCLDIQISIGVIRDCSKCSFTIREGELLQLIPGFFGDAAMVLIDGKIEKVPLNRIFDVKEKEN